MILDAAIPGARVYANPLRTCHHRCEVDLARIRGDLGLPAHEQSPCAYHDCCLMEEEVWMCPQHPDSIVAADVEAQDDDEAGEPETCAAYVLEHRHVPLRTWEVVAAWAMEAGAPVPGVFPAASWQPYAELDWDRDWRPVYRQDPSKYPRWQEAVFARGEELHRRRADRDLHEFVLLDLPGTADWATRATAVDNYFRAAHALCVLEMRIYESFYLAAISP